MFAQSAEQLTEYFGAKPEMVQVHSKAPALSERYGPKILPKELSTDRSRWVYDGFPMGIVWTSLNKISVYECVYKIIVGN